MNTKLFGGGCLMFLIGEVFYFCCFPCLHQVGQLRAFFQWVMWSKQINGCYYLRSLLIFCCYRCHTKSILCGCLLKCPAPYINRMILHKISYRHTVQFCVTQVKNWNKQSTMLSKCPIYLTGHCHSIVPQNNNFTTITFTIPFVFFLGFWFSILVLSVHYKSIDTSLPRS